MKQNILGCLGLTTVAKSSTLDVSRDPNYAFTMNIFILIEIKFYSLFYNLSFIRQYKNLNAVKYFKKEEMLS